MKDCSRSSGEVQLFLLVCLVLFISSVESFNWTAQPTNQTQAIKGQDVSLTWNYSLTAAEQLKTQTLYGIIWKRLTQSSSVYDIIGTKNYVKFPGNPGTLNYAEPKDPHIVVDRTDPATLHIKDVRREDEGTYKIEFFLQLGGTNAIADHEMNLTVLEPSEIGNMSNNQDVCEGSMVTLNCNATGKPTPNITWTRVWENGTDSEQLQVVDGNYVMSNITRSSNGTYRCTAYNGVGDPVNRTVEVIVGYSASVVRVVSSSNTVIEGDTYNLNCEVSGDPEPTVTWIKESNDQRSDGNILNFTNIKRSDSGDYRCEAENKCGKEVKNASINVFYQPDIVTLVTNTTENKDCSDLWVNFTCISSEANPPVYNYLLFEDGKVFSSSKSGTWIEKISREGKVIYNCVAYQLVGNVTSTNNVTLTVNVPLSMKQLENKIVKEEGDSVEVYCNVTGIPEPTVIWKNVKTDAVIGGNPLNITDITRAQAGEYRCTVNNTCGEESTVVDIDVQYPPKNVRLNTNLTSKVCAGIIINFTCTAEANPPVHTYLLYKNDTVIGSRTVIKTMDTAGLFVFRCKANNSIQGTGRSSDTILTVGVPASVHVEPAENKIVKTEGKKVEVYCNGTGFPDPTVTWKNVTSGHFIEGNPLNITDITRAQAGEYRCTVNNTCGEESTVVDIDVQYKPDMVTLVTNTTENKDCSDLWVNFTCISSEANPPVYNYLLFEDGKGLSFSKSGTWIEKISREGQVIYNCVAFQHVGNVTSTNNVTLIVNVPLSMKKEENKIVKKEGENVEVHCNVTGIPEPTVIWKNVKTDAIIGGNPLNITNITRAQAGKYRCTANNTCGNESTVVDIDVQYKPGNVHLKANMTSNTVCTGIIINFTCIAEANPPVHIYLLYENDTVIKDMGKVGTVIKTMDTTDQFVFRCEANNSVQGTGRSSDTILTVDVAASIKLEEKKIVKEGDDVEVYCNVTGIPDPTVTWTNVTSGDLIEGNPLNITDITRAQAGKYRCTANNTCGNESTVVEIDVQYPPSNTSDGRPITVTEGSNASISCPVDGNPQPNITWEKENSSAKKIEKRTLEFYEAKLSDRGSYTCSAENYLGTVRVTICLIVEKPPTTTSSTPTTEEGSTEVHAKATIDESCDKRLEVEKEFPDVACELNKDKGCVSAKATDSRCGSVIIDFVMNFNQSVDGKKVLAVLKDAAQKNKFGDYKVNSIKLIAPSSTVTPSTPEPDLSGFFTNKDGSIKIGIAIGFAVVGVVIICAIVACVAWCVHKKRKCRKDPRVHDSAVEEQPLSRQDCTQENPYAHDNNGYAGAGPQSTETSDMEQSQGASGPVTVPTYAVVDKSKKKGKKDKKKDKQAAEQKPTEDQYAVVDKSKKKKKKKEEPDATYAQVDMSKKSKKKAKPGECLYADLGEFNQMREMPKVSTSPQPLPPVKKPTPYGETEYADITQFLKEGAKLPGSNNSQGQATKTDSNSQGQAALANSNSSQGQATLANSNSSQGQATLANSDNSQGQAALANSNSSQGQATLANGNSSQGPATDTKNTGVDGKDGRANNETCL